MRAGALLTLVDIESGSGGVSFRELNLPEIHLTAGCSELELPYCSVPQKSYK